MIIDTPSPLLQMRFSLGVIPTQQVQANASVSQPIDDGCCYTERPENVCLTDNSITVWDRNDSDGIRVIRSNLGGEELIDFALKKTNVVTVYLRINAVDPEIEAAVQRFSFHYPFHMYRLPLDLGAIFLVLGVIRDQASYGDVCHRRIASSSSDVSVSIRVLECFKNFAGQVSVSSSTTERMIKSHLSFF